MVRDYRVGIELTSPPGALKQHVFSIIVVLWQLSWALGQNGGLPADAEPSSAAASKTALTEKSIFTVNIKLDRQGRNHCKKRMAGA